MQLARGHWADSKQALLLRVGGQTRGEGRKKRTQKKQETSTSSPQHLLLVRCSKLMGTRCCELTDTPPFFFASCNRFLSVFLTTFSERSSSCYVSSCCCCFLCSCSCSFRFFPPRLVRLQLLSYPFTACKLFYGDYPTRFSFTPTHCLKSPTPVF